MRRKDQADRTPPNVVNGTFGRDLTARREEALELPQFLLCALEARVAEANEGAAPEECCTVEQFIETELVHLVTVRDVVELDARMPGFAEAVFGWVVELR